MLSVRDPEDQSGAGLEASEQVEFWLHKSEMAWCPSRRGEQLGDEFGSQRRGWKWRFAWGRSTQMV